MDALREDVLNRTTDASGEEFFATEEGGIKENMREKRGQKVNNEEIFER